MATAENGLATILDINYITQPTNDTTLGFSVPYFNNIMLISSEFASSNGLKVYYGDEMTFDIWEHLSMVIYDIFDTDTIYTMHEGWLYKYYYNKKEFIIYDENRNIVEHKYNVYTVSDLHIDFSVISNHAFEVIIENVTPESLFLIPTKLKKKTFGDNCVIKVPRNIVNNTYKILEDVSNVNNKRINPAHKASYIKYIIQKIYDVYYTDKHFGTIPISYLVHKNNNVYSANYNTEFAIHVPKEFIIRELEVSLLFSVFNRTMHPYYEPIERLGETHNNRPVYEPWLICNLFAKLFESANGGFDDEEIDDYPVPTLDFISPNWSY